MGKVFIATKSRKHKWVKPPLGMEVVKVDVTSAQGLKSKNRRDFSPMTHIEGNYKGFWNFESYWQSGKVFKEIPRNQFKILENFNKIWKNISQRKG